MGMPVRMTLCPNCHTIQKAGQPCSICKYPVPWNKGPEEAPERRTQPDRRQVERRITGKDFLDKE